MKLWSDSWTNGDPIPARYAAGRLDAGKSVEFSDNLSPHFAWSGLPPGTKSLALICCDGDVPSKGDDVNQAGREVPADLPRTDFFHWVLADMPADAGPLAEGLFCRGFTPHGKTGPTVEAAGFGTSRHGINDYTGWFASDASMAGDYYGYDGPFPPWNDSILHHYVFTLYALDIARAPVEGRFNCAALRSAIKAHVLGEAAHSGIYTLNRRLVG